MPRSRSACWSSTWNKPARPPAATAAGLAGATVRSGVRTGRSYNRAWAGYRGSTEVDVSSIAAIERIHSEVVRELATRGADARGIRSPRAATSRTLSGPRWPPEPLRSVAVPDAQS